MEEGIENASQGGGGASPLIVRFDHYDEETSKSYFDKTWQEVKDAFDAGQPVYLQSDGSRDYLVSIDSSRIYNAGFRGSGVVDATVVLSADNPNDYLSMS